MDRQLRHRHRLEQLDQTPIGKINYFGGVNWTSKDQKTTLAWENVHRQHRRRPIPQATRFHYDLVFTQKIGEKWQFAFEHNLGYDSGAVATNNGFTHGDWFSFAPYFIYTINDCWSAGMRYEWFSDIDGIVVEQVGPPTIPAVPAIYNALTWGVNWKPHKSKNVLIRSELRYDWANDSLPAGQRPFDAGEKNDAIPLGDRLDREVLTGSALDLQERRWGAPAARWRRCPPLLGELRT